MKHHGFTARQAMGWLRVVQPGSVIGQQQQYLCAMEGPMRRAAADFAQRGGAAAVAKAGEGVSGVYGVVGAVLRTVDGMFQQAAARHGRRLRPSGSSGNLRVVFEDDADSLWTASVAGPAAAELAEHVSQAAAARSAARSQLAAAPVSAALAAPFPTE